VSFISKIDSQGLKLPLENLDEEGGKSSMAFANVLEKFRKKQDKE
jgi:hypothetical protein